jgi:hypothetical protein
VTTKIALFNSALTELGHRTLADTGEAVEAGRLLNQVYTQVVDECISAGSWNWATETIMADADTGVTPAFGFPKVFAKPVDFVRTVGVSADEYFSMPLIHYYDDINFWSADLSPIYVRYVSRDTGMGLELSRWPANFTRFVELELASRIAPKLTQNASEREALNERRDKARKRALNVDAMNEANPKFPPPGGWTLSRGGQSGGERGSRSRLTG